MSTSITSPTAAADLVRTGYEAFGRGDMATLGEVFAPDSVWRHLNDDRFSEPLVGFDAIAAFFAESVQLTGGTLRVSPTRWLVDDQADTVAVIVHMDGRRPDGRVLDDDQVHVFRLGPNGRVASVDQYIGQPDAVTAFWA
jgi:ketosteroid isomerase-like protein